MSLGLVVLDKKLFTQTRMRMRTPTPQSDDKSADIKKYEAVKFINGRIAVKGNSIIM